MSQVQYIPPVTNERKTDDVHFGETLGRLLSGIEDGQEKDFLKLELQRMILNLKYSQRNQDRTQSDFHIQRSGMPTTHDSSILTTPPPYRYPNMGLQR